MQPGWKLNNGLILNDKPSESELWARFNFVFSDSCLKRNTYKFALIKSILDSLLSAEKQNNSYFISFDNIFHKFAECYWNLVVKYKMKQMRPDGRSMYSVIESIFNDMVNDNPALSNIEYISLSDEDVNKIYSVVIKECKRYVVGALYSDMDGLLYAFDKKSLEGLVFSEASYSFMLNYKIQLEKLNYYAWAKYLETINDESITTQLINKLELSIPQRNDLSVYRKILFEEFGQQNCIYCGRKLKSNSPVDHVIPWSFFKEDKLWNFVLCCQSCNSKKSNKVPSKEVLEEIIKRNEDPFFYRYEDFNTYDEEMLWKLREYAYLSGLKEYKKPSE